MTRRILSLLLALAALLLPAGALAENAGFEVTAYEDGYSYIVRYTGSSADVVIPDSFVVYGDNCPLGGILDEAFAYNTAVETVVIPEGAITIGYNAFFGCENLKKVVLPSTIEQIYDEAFAQCPNLTEINLPAELWYVGADVFAGCDQLNLDAQQEEAVTDTVTTRHEAEQAAFVVDPENMTDLSAVLGMPLDEIPAVFEDARKEDYSDGPAYSISGAVLSGFSTWRIVDGIQLSEKSNYSILGVYITMDGNDAMRDLLKSGWTIIEKADGRMHFNDANGNTLGFWTNGQGAITDIWFDIHFDIAQLVADGAYSAQNIFGAPEQSASAASARTTGDVKMRSDAGLNYETIMVVPGNVTVEYLGQSKTDSRGVEWYFIRYNGQSGWCSSKFIELQ